MRLIDIVNGAWAIGLPMLEEIQSIYKRHLKGDKIDLSSLEADLGRPLRNERKNYLVEDGVAILAVDGVIAKKMNLFSRISGGVSSQLVAKDFSDAMADNDVRSIVLAMDSPGGTVDGTPELAELIYNSRGIKPILGHCDGMMASAMYWIGSAVDSINISSDVVTVGSIGVVASHVDVSRMQEKAGVKTTEIYAGKYKRIASRYKPLTEEGKASIQDVVDYMYSVFVEDVAKHRGVSTEEVLSGMADGQIFYGSQAVDAGLVDRIATFGDTLDQARDLADRKTKTSRAGVALGKNKVEAGAASDKTKQIEAGAASKPKQESIMDLETFKKEYPNLVISLREEFSAEAEGLISAAREEGLTVGADAERQRINDVRAQSLPGHESLVEKLAFDGKTTGPEAAQQIVAAENSTRKTMESALDEDAPLAVNSIDAGDDELTEKTIKRADFDNLSHAEKTAVRESGTKIID